MQERQMTTLEERDQVRRCSRGGFAFLFVNGLAWIFATALTFVLPIQTAALVIIWQGMLTLPLSFALERALKFPRMPRSNTLIPLLIQTASVQLPALLAVIIVYNLQPAYVPATFAAIVGGHLLPYVWINRSMIYGVVAALVAGVPFGMLVVWGAASFNYAGFAVGVILITAACVLFVQTSHELEQRPELAGAVRT